MRNAGTREMHPYLLIWRWWAPALMVARPEPAKVHQGVTSPLYGLEIGRDVRRQVPVCVQWHWGHKTWGFWLDGQIIKPWRK